MTLYFSSKNPHGVIIQQIRIAIIVCMYYDLNAIV